MRNQIIVSLGILALLAGCSSNEPVRTYTNPEATLPEPFSTISIPYIEDGNYRHQLDVHLPQTGESSYPVIMAIHGGGFYARGKNLYKPYAPIYNDMGFAMVSTNYRLTPDTTYPGQVEDVACALAWIHSEGPQYKLDPSRVIIMGGSAGGYLAAMLATHDDLNSFLDSCPYTLSQGETRLGAVILYGYTNFTNQATLEIDKNRDELEKFWGKTYEEISQEQLAEMSPITWIDNSDKPFLVLHGTIDTSISVEMSYEFVEALEDAGVRVETYYPELNHAFDLGSLTEESILEGYQRIDQFINSLIK